MSATQGVWRVLYWPRVVVRVSAATVVVVVAALLAIVAIAMPIGVVRERSSWLVAQLASRGLLSSLGIATSVRGPQPPSGMLIVANHLSWLDILAILSRWRCVFIAKSEVRSWPVIGKLGDALGVIWIDRRRARDLLRVIPLVQSALGAGKRVLVFPEGSTTNGINMLPFRSGLFEAAVRGQRPVLPIAISGSVTTQRLGSGDALCWYGTELLLTNLVRVAGLRGAQLGLHMGAPIDAGVDRKTLACASQLQVHRRFRQVCSRPAAHAYDLSDLAKQNFRPIDSSEREIFA